MPALALLALHAVAAHAHAPVEVCEYRTINYITHILPQQCLRTSWTSPTPTATDSSNLNGTAHPTVTTTTTATVTESPGAAHDNATAQEQDSPEEELAASSFMSFEEWKEMMLRKSGQDPANIKPHHKQQREHRDRDRDDMDSFGEEGEISLDFDALADKVSEITSPPTGATVPDTDQAAKEDQILYDDGKTQYYRSKDAGKTCKERFSYASFDAGATILKTSPGAKNAKAILVENKDSYMLLECRAKSKFVIVELSDDILVDTVVLANFEFFSSMIRKFRVSVSDRYPVKLDKWVDLGTFEARNSRDLQPFLIEHPQIYTKYIRVEFLTHWGNEFYCPVSLLRVHGTRMLDSWKEPNHDDEPEQIDGPAQEPVEETPQAQEPTTTDETSSAYAKETSIPSDVAGTGSTPWHPVFGRDVVLEMCELRSPTTAAPTPVESGSRNSVKKPAAAPDSVTPRPSAAPRAEESRLSGSSAEPASPESPAPRVKSASAGSPAAPSTAPQAGSSQKQPDARADAADNSSATTTTPRNKTSSAASAASASPTVQESFFKTITKRLQLLESNTSLSLQYIEEQSRFMQDVLLKMERRQITRVDSFLDTLNKTVLSELRTLRTQYDQIWQSTVLALETQHDQSEREVVALTSRLNILADEVVFQKRMAILQSVLLLACLVLVIFTRGGLGGLDNTTFPALPPAYRRYGYGYNPARSDSISGLSLPADSSPPGAGPTDPASPNSTLAASALPRHLYRLSPSSFKNKSLPLTPPSEYSRESTPAAHRSPEPSFYDQQAPQGEEETPQRTPLRRTQSSSAAEAPPPSSQDDADAELSSIETSQADTTTILTTPLPTREQEDQEEERAAAAGVPLAGGAAGERRSGLSRKPLPALPEDPSGSGSGSGSLSGLND